MRKIFCIRKLVHTHTLLTLMQRNIENGNVTTINITEITVRRKAHRPEELDPLARKSKQRERRKT